VQERGTISGRVTDANNNEPIVGVNVVIPTLNIGAVSDIDGNYSIANVPVGTRVVVARFLGYQMIRREVTVAANSTLTLDFSLVEESIGLSELVVTGTAGDTRRKAVGNAVSRVNASDVLEKTARSGI